MPTLDWIGKKAVINHHLTVPYRLLKGEEELSVGEAGSGNLLVQGDNLLALKALLPYYAGQVKCIYIDPPYNTGNEGWVYNDNNNAPEIKKWLGRTVGSESEDLSRHDKWLCMMYPRLQLLHQLLREDGAVILHIDEHSVAELILLLDEVFGPQNSLGHIIWDKGNPKGDARDISFQHETLVIYAKCREGFIENSSLERPKPNAERMLKAARRAFVKIGERRLPDDLEDAIKRYELEPESLRQFEREFSIADANEEYQRWIRSQSELSGGEAMYKWIDELGEVYRLASMAWPNKKRAPEEYFTPLTHPVTGQPCPVPARGWRYPPASMERLRQQGLLVFGADHTTQPQHKYLLRENMKENLPSVLRYAGSDDSFFSKLGLPFQNPKPHGFATPLLGVFASEKDSLILDSFAGSGTTGHAVMKLNAADGGNRRFILVEMEENIARNITAERLKRVIHGYGDTPGLGGGFRFATLGTPLFDEHGQISDAVRFADLARHVYFSETGEPQPNTTNGKTPLIGVCGRTAYYLLFNGILGDKTAAGGNVLTDKILRQLPAHPMGSDNPRVIFGEGCRLGAARLEREGIIFKQLPYEIKVN